MSGKAPRALFVYWKTEAASAPQAVAAATHLQRQLRSEHPGLVAQLFQRADARDGQATVMETYAHAQGVSAALQGAIARAAEPVLAAWCQGARHVEVFNALPP